MLDPTNTDRLFCDVLLWFCSKMVYLWFNITIIYIAPPALNNSWDVNFGWRKLQSWTCQVDPALGFFDVDIYPILGLVEHTSRGKLKWIVSWATALQFSTVPLVLSLKRYSQRFKGWNENCFSSMLLLCKPKLLKTFSICKLTFVTHLSVPVCTSIANARCPRSWAHTSACGWSYCWWSFLASLSLLIGRL